MNRQERVLIPGPGGKIEVFVEPVEEVRGIALVAHPHPLFGGSADNKVVTTVARAFRELGYVTLRPNFRGVGASEGEHDHGIGETLDLLAVHAYARSRFAGQGAPLPFALAGFSFGAYVVSRLARALAEAGDPAERLVLIGTAAGHVEGTRSYQTEAVAPDSVVIHGSADETVPLANVVAWATPLELPIVLVPGADHFFHRKLHIIRNIIHSAWRRQCP
ncbi:MAG TPA: thioesterase domain-containing protein [Rhodocyclaceae bacterium]|nr:thioesterase domain-containing protein [Rhodocyclaceae bacterium]